MDRIRQFIFEVAEANHPMGIRQLFYQASNAKLVAKTEAECKGTIGRLIGEMREAGELPWEWISDHTRWQRKPKTYSSVPEFVARVQSDYRRAVWDRQSVTVEVWLEKAGLAGVIHEVTERWDVPLFATAGFTSKTWLYTAAKQIERTGKPAYIYQFGDHDPSGVCIRDCIERDLRRHAPKSEIHVIRVAVTPEQIERYGLPSRPTKRTDSRSRGWRGESTELDALPPRVLKSLVETCIARHIDQEELRRVLQVEKVERETLNCFATEFFANYEWAEEQAKRRLGLAP